MREYDGWVLEGPDGSIFPETFGVTKDDCWEEGFWVLCGEVENFRERYWKKWDASIRAANKAGFKMVKVRFERV